MSYRNPEPEGVDEVRFISSLVRASDVVEGEAADVQPLHVISEGAVSEEGECAQYTERVEKTFAMASVSFPGRDHILGSLKGAGNQDSRGRRVTKQGIILVCSDGCGSTLDSGTGSKAMVRLVLNMAEKLLTRRPTLPTPKVFAEQLEAVLLSRLRLAALAISADRNIDDVLIQSYLCTVLIAVVTPHWTAVMGCGDGFYAINGEVVEIPPRPGNQPEYLAYKLLSEVPKGFEKIGLKVLKAVDTLDVSSVAIATDGIEPVASRRIQGFSFADVWEKPELRDPTALMNELSRLSEDRTECQIDNTVYPPRGHVVITPGIFADDTTMVYLVRDPGMTLPAEWIVYRRARSLRLPEASRKSTMSWFGFGRKTDIHATPPVAKFEEPPVGNPYAIDTKVSIAGPKHSRSLFGICIALLQYLFSTPKSKVPKDTRQRSSHLSYSKKERKW